MCVQEGGLAVSCMNALTPLVRDVFDLLGTEVGEFMLVHFWMVLHGALKGLGCV